MAKRLLQLARTCRIEAGEGFTASNSWIVQQPSLKRSSGRRASLCRSCAMFHLLCSNGVQLPGSGQLTSMVVTSRWFIDSSSTGWNRSSPHLHRSSPLMIPATATQMIGFSGWAWKTHFGSTSTIAVGSWSDFASCRHRIGTGQPSTGSTATIRFSLCFATWRFTISSMRIALKNCF